jgi:phosphonate transport system substrate-binding protein
MERYKPLAAYLSEKTGVKIELKILSRYGNIINNFNTMGLDGAFFGSFTYALAHTRVAVETLARPESPEGVSTYYGMIFVRKDSGITSAAQMKGKRFAFVDKATTAGYLLPLKYFKDNGIEDYQSYFTETYFTGTHEDAVYDVLNGRAEVGAAKNTVYYRLAHADSRILDELEILVQSPEVPSNALAIRADLEEPLRLRIKNALLNMDRDPEGREVLKDFGQSRFIETTNADYEPVFNYAKEAGLDLATYDWMNE